MPKSIFKITEFDGGENRVNDPRDLQLNECVQAKGIEFDKLGRIRVAGSGFQLYLANFMYGTQGTLPLNMRLSSGYGIFKFKHDFNMDEFVQGNNPQETPTEFIAISYLHQSNIHKIGFIDSRSYEYVNNEDYDMNGDAFFATVFSYTDEAVNKKLKTQFYYADAGLRIFDSELKNNSPFIYYGHIKRDFFTKVEGFDESPLTVNTWIKDNQSLELSNKANSSRPYENQDRTFASLEFHQALSADFPTGEGKGEVILQISENSTTGTNAKRHVIDASSVNTGITTCTTTGENHGFVAGDMIQIWGITGEEIFNGQYEVIDAPTSSTFTISAESSNDDFNGAYVSKIEDMLNEELRGKWIYGISYILDGRQETKIATGSIYNASFETTNNSDIMNNSTTILTDGTEIKHYDDWTTFMNEPKIRFGFKHGTEEGKWHERITGFRIYMKNIEGITSDQISRNWNLLLDVDFVKGIYVLPGKDSIEKTLTFSEGYRMSNYPDGSEAQNWDDIRYLSPITYESINTYSNDDIIEAKYKTAVIANERCYIGNILQNGQTFPDRIIKSPVGAFDVFPESNILEGITSDGDSIVKLEYFGDRLFCFKRDTLHIINISDEEEYVEESLSGHGIDEPCQVTKTNDGISYVNGSGLYLHNGSEFVNLTKNKINPFNFNSNDLERKGFFNKGSKPNLGYDSESNKLILSRSSVASNFSVNISADQTGSGGNNQDLSIAFSAGGFIYEANGNKAPNIGDVFKLSNGAGHDLLLDELSIAKYGVGGKSLALNDHFIITSNFITYPSIQYLDIDPDVFIYDLTNNCFSLRNFAFGSNNTSYTMTNFINTKIFKNTNKLVLLKDNSSLQNGSDVDIMSWEDSSQDITDMDGTFSYITRDIDFGDPSIRKKIYKLYITFKTGDGINTYSDSNVRVYYSSNQSSTWTEFDDSSSNYNSTKGLYSENSSLDWQSAELKPTNSINNIYSLQLKFVNTSDDVPKGFQINDISIVYRKKPIK